MSPERRAAAALAFAAAVCASYALQRLVDAGSEPPLGAVLRQATVPFYWRSALALVHGAGAAALAWVALPGDRAAAWLPRLTWLLPAVVLPAALAMALVP